MPSTASSGWLSFARPIGRDHVRHVDPDPTSLDQRIEVICAKSGCHLGHYFGSDGYCINASCLNFLLATNKLSDPIDKDPERQVPISPISYRSLEQSTDATTPSVRLLRQVLQRHELPLETIVLGAGCFWHVEFALRRLPGVVETTAGYAGSDDASPPTYQQVCQGDTGHAEVVRVDFDPNILHPRILLDCYLALHDPTKVRAHGKHAAGTGQYRSCIFLPTDSLLQQHVQEALESCQKQLNKELSTEVRAMPCSVSEFFFPAEERHQRHDERRQEGVCSPEELLSTLAPPDWIALYGRRSDSVLGSARTLDEEVADERFSVRGSARSLDEEVANMRFMI
jgi:peptide-methionine (S)-S-oxide reductase